MKKVHPIAVLLALVLGLVLGLPRSKALDYSSSWNAATITPTNTNGTTPVSLVAGVANRQAMPVKVTVYNSDTVVHDVFLLSNTTTIYPIVLPPGAGMVLDSESGWIRTAYGEALQIKIDAGGVGTSVRVSGLAAH
jgi:hypothetical protein